MLSKHSALKGEARRDLGGLLKGLPYLLLLFPKELGFHGELQHSVPEITSPLSKPALKLFWPTRWKSRGSLAESCQELPSLKDVWGRISPKLCEDAPVSCHPEGSQGLWEGQSGC